MFKTFALAAALVALASPALAGDGYYPAMAERAVQKCTGATVDGFKTPRIVARDPVALAAAVDAGDKFSLEFGRNMFDQQFGADPTSACKVVAALAPRLVQIAK